MTEQELKWDDVVKVVSAWNGYDDYVYVEGELVYARPYVELFIEHEVMEPKEDNHK